MKSDNSRVSVECSFLKVIKYWLLAHFPSFAGKKQEADELSGDASVDDEAFVKVKCQSLG